MLRSQLVVLLLQLAVRLLQLNVVLHVILVQIHNVGDADQPVAVRVDEPPERRVLLHALWEKAHVDCLGAVWQAAAPAQYGPLRRRGLEGKRRRHRVDHPASCLRHDARTRAT